MIGATLAHYQITQHLGSGGMGDVYQATDSKLGRSVAIKLLPESFSRDFDRTARMEREARTLALVNHPNIASIYGLEDAGGTRFLVMELVPGETLAERISRGPIPLKEALVIARQIADALEAAHDKGIVHRDLKPANIKITPDLHVKVLDFGLAKALADETRSTGLSNSPTRSLLGTQDGVIQGTAPYMSPEQAQGKETDRRTDIFAMGSVLYEMLTGRAAFFGESIPQVLARVIEQEPDWTLLPSTTPTSVRRVLRRCLEKDRNRRLKSADTVRLEIEDTFSSPEDASAESVKLAGNRTSRGVFAVLGVALLAASIPAIQHLRETAPAQPPEMRTDIATPTTSDPASFAISPDSRYVAYVASGTGQQRLWLRALTSSSAQPLPGTEGASYPFWSPDSQSLGFFDGSKLKRVEVSGGPPRVLADAANRGGSWNSDDVILFARTVGGGLSTIPASGGKPTLVTRLENQTSHRFPYFLPDGKHFVYYAIGSPEHGGLHLGVLGQEGGKRLIASDSAGVYSRGWVLFVRSGTLLAQRLDVEKGTLVGEIVTVADSASFEASSYGAAISASNGGLLAFRAGGATRRQFSWFDRSGKPLGAWGPPDESVMTPDISPDGKRVIGWRVVQGNSDIWLLDENRMTRLTFDPSLDRYPVWTRDGSRIFFDSARSGPRTVFEISPDTPGGEREFFRSPQDKVVNDVSPDGRHLIIGVSEAETGWDLWLVPLQGSQPPVRFLATAFDERRGQFSPDGKWVTYTSNESGQQEVYVRPTDGAPGQWQVSNGGGAFARWAASGKELFYLSQDGTLMAAAIAVKGSALEPGAPKSLFRTRIVGGGTDMNMGIQFDVAPDGRFLINNLLDDVGASPITLIQNWNPR